MRAIAYSFKGHPKAFCLALPIPQLEGAPEAWVHVASEGKWFGHANGPFEFTRERFAECVSNFSSKINPTKLDFDHETIFDPPPLPARGWVTDMEIRDDSAGNAQLWAKVQFGEQAAELVRSGGMPFCSGVFEFSYVDPTSGKSVGCCMTSLSLTAQPFLDGQTPIILSQRFLSKGETKFMEDEIKDPADQLEEEKKEAEEVALADEPSLEPFMALAEKFGLSLAELAAKLDEKADAVKAALTDEAPASEPAPELPLSAAQATIKALSARMNAAEAQLAAYREKEAEQAVAELVEGGHLLDSGRAQMKALYLSNREAFNSIKSALPKIVPTGEHASAIVDQGPTTSELIDEEDPDVKAKRVFLSQAGIPKDKQDARLKRELAARNQRI